MLKAFTLIELLIGVVIMGAVAIISTQLLWDTVSVRSKQQSIEDSSDNIRQILSLMTKSIVSAESVEVKKIIIDFIEYNTLKIKGKPCRTFTFNSSNKSINLDEITEPCTPSETIGKSLTDNNIDISKLDFTKNGTVIKIDIEGIYNDNLGEHTFSYTTSAIRRTSL